METETTFAKGTRVRMTGDIGDATPTGTVVAHRATVDPGPDTRDPARLVVRFDDGETVDCDPVDLEELPTFVCGEGVIWDMAYAQCPKCRRALHLTDRGPMSSMGRLFDCPSCGMRCDEPTFEPAEVAYLGTVDDDDDEPAAPVAPVVHQYGLAGAGNAGDRCDGCGSIRGQDLKRDARGRYGCGWCAPRDAGQTVDARGTVIPDGAEVHPSGTGYVHGGITFPGADWNRYVATRDDGRLISAFRARSNMWANVHADNLATYHGGIVVNVSRIDGEGERRHAFPVARVSDPERLNDLCEIGHVIKVQTNGVAIDTIPNIRETWAPECIHDGFGDGVHIEPGSGWSLVDGYSGQHGYAGPIMHASESIGGRMAVDMLARPGFYVAIVCEVMSEDPDASENDEPAGWALAFRPLDSVPT